MHVLLSTRIRPEVRLESMSVNHRARLNGAPGIEGWGRFHYWNPVASRREQTMLTRSGGFRGAWEVREEKPEGGPYGPVERAVR
jgi:hypothetical protein